MSNLKKETICILVLTIFGFLFFYKTFHFGFFNIDDHMHSTDNLAVQTFDLKGLFFKFHLGLYYPLSMLSFALDWWLGGGAPWVFHLSNFIFHLLGTLVLFKICLKFWPNKVLLALLISLAFLLHPLKAESVVWITERKDVLSGLFLWLTIYLYLFYLDHAKKRFYVLANLTFLFAAASKASVVGLPLFLLILDWYRNKKIGVGALIEKIPFVLSAIFFGIVNVIAQSRIKDSFILPEINYLQLLYKIEFYLEKFLLPWGLRVWYSPGGLNLSLIGLLAALMIVLLAIVIIKRSSAQRKDIILGLSFFVIFLFPNLKLVPFGDESIVNDRYMYIALTGLTFAFFPFILQSIEDLWKKERRIFACAISGVFAAIVLQWLVFMHVQIAYWRNPLTLWQRTALLEPGSGRVAGNLGKALLKAGQYEEALNYLQRSSGRIDDFETLGYVLTLMQRPEQAQGAILEGLKIYPDNSSLLNILATMKYAYKEYEEALNLFTKALQNLKNEPSLELRGMILNNLGLVNLQLGNYKAAESWFGAALNLDNNDDDIIYNLGFSLLNQNRLEEAKSAFLQALTLNPGRVEIYNSIAVIFYKEKNFAQARLWFNRALEVDPNFEVARNNLMAVEEEEQKQ